MREGCLVLVYSYVSSTKYITIFKNAVQRLTLKIFCEMIIEKKYWQKLRQINSKFTKQLIS